MAEWAMALGAVGFVVALVTGAFAFLAWFVDRIDRKGR